MRNSGGQQTPCGASPTRRGGSETRLTATCERGADGREGSYWKEFRIRGSGGRASADQQVLLRKCPSCYGSTISTTGPSEFCILNSAFRLTYFHSGRRPGVQ